MSTHVNTRHYVNSHGQPPRGRGLWLFESPDRLIVEVTGRYAAAAASVRRQHPRVAEWTVLP